MLADKPITDLTSEINRVLTHAYDSVIETAMPPVMDMYLRNDLLHFSGFKTHAELQEVAAMLRTDDGKVKPFEAFARDVQAVHKTYNINYLNAEYNLAVSSAQSAAQWAAYESDGNRYNLQYRTANDEHVRDSHVLLHNTTLPIDDPFWDKYYPPNGWGCRCNVVQVRKSKYEVSDSDTAMTNGLEATRQISGGVDKGAIFRWNPGKSRTLMPPKHPYYKTSNAEEIEKLCNKQIFKEQRNQLRNWAKDNLVGTTTHNDTIGVITYGMKGIKEYLDAPHKKYTAKNESLRNIDALISQGKYLKNSIDTKGRYKQFHYLQTNIDGVESYINIAETYDGKFLLYTITDLLK